MTLTVNAEPAEPLTEGAHPPALPEVEKSLSASSLMEEAKFNEKVAVRELVIDTEGMNDVTEGPFA